MLKKGKEWLMEFIHPTQKDTEVKSSRPIRIVKTQKPVTLEEVQRRRLQNLNHSNDVSSSQFSSDPEIAAQEIVRYLRRPNTSKH